jgi:hypothetical protein
MDRVSIEQFVTTRMVEKDGEDISDFGATAFRD